MCSRKVESQLVGARERRIPIETLECLGDGGVQQPRSCLPQFRVDHLLKQRVRKIVVDRINASGLLENALGKQLVESGDDLLLGKTGNCSQRIMRSAGAYHSSKVRKCPGVEREPIDASLYHIPDCSRKFESLHLPTGPASVFLRERAGFDERFERFLDEE